MVDAAGDRRDGIARHAQDAGDLLLAHEDAVAEADGLHGRQARDGLAQLALGVGEVQQQRLRAELFHVLADRHYQLQAPQRMERRPRPAASSQRHAHRCPPAAPMIARRIPEMRSRSSQASALR